MRKAFIVNSRSDSGDLDKFKAAVAGFSEHHKSECEFYYTEHASHATELAGKLSEGSDGDLLIVACGGDGTVHEIANVLAGTNVPMAVVPMGTGNDFARSIMSENHRNSCEYCVSELIKDDYEIKPIDLIKVESYDAEGNLIPESSAWCNNVASIGLDTEVQLRAKTKVLKHPKSALVRKTAYATSAVGALFGNRGFDFKFYASRGDGRPSESEGSRYTLISVCNGSYYGNGFCPAPGASVDDGLLDICAVDDVGLGRAIFLISKYAKGKHVGLLNIDTFQVDSITVEATGDKPLNGNYDGEDFSGRKVVFTCESGALALAFYK